jgi:hypothetical protein
VVTGLYPFLASGDVRIRTVVAGAIKESESLDENWRPDFSCHTAILQDELARCGELPAGLVAYMFARDVERAVGALKTVDAEVPNKGDDGFSFERVLSEAGTRERR